MRWPLLVIGIAGLAAGGALYFTVNTLRINTYPGNVLSDDLPWRQDLIAYDKAFPQSRDSIVIVIDGATPDQARDAAARLYQQLSKDKRNFEWVFFPQESRFFREGGLLFENLPDLETLSSRLAQVQPFLSEVSTDRSVRGLFSLLQRAMKEDKAGELELGNVFGSIAGAIRGYLEGSSAHLSWIELMSGKKSAPQDRRALIEVMPRIEFNSLAPSQDSLEAIQRAAAAVKLEHSGIEIRLTGEGALSLDELRSASLGAQMASIGSFLGVSLVMLIGLRSFWLVLSAQIALVLGLVFTAAFAALALGELNLISVAFSVMYIGLGADYAIYLCLRYRELARASLSHRSALNRAVRHVAGSLEIGTLTTAIGFFCFVPTSYAGVAELGIISGVGMFISLFVTLAILPALLSLRRPVRYRGRHLRPAQLPRFAIAAMAFPMRHSRWVLAACCVLAVLAVWALRFAQFDQNPLDLQDPQAESVQAFRELLRDSRNSPWSLAVLARNADEAGRLKQQLEELPLVDGVRTLDDFVPADQSAKLAVIDQLGLTLGSDLGNPTARPQPTSEQEENALRTFLATLSAYLSANPEAPHARPGAELQRELTRLLARIDGLPPEAKGQALNDATYVLLGSLKSQLSQLADALRAHAVDADDLPPDFRSRWVSEHGLHRVEIRPKEDLNDPAAIRRFVEQVRRIAPHATGLPVVYLESSAAVVRAFLEAFAYALVAITIILFLTLERKIDVLLVLAPLLLAALLTGATITLLGIHFNFANIIALPLVFGMGVDNCIHMVHRFRTAPPRDGIVLHTSTALAVVLSALTNISGFGSLALSPHRGMASMGMVLTIGILITLLCSLIVLPSLVSRMHRFDHGLEHDAQRAP
ncbi:MAG: MMPL family transporter [Burkholderiales bacterium]|nr:MMPL family transporter [Burkholderiales bacterium]